MTIASAVGDAFGQLRTFIILWIPPLLLAFLVYLLWRFIKVMPRDFKRVIAERAEREAQEAVSA